MSKLIEVFVLPFTLKIIYFLNRRISYFLIVERGIIRYLIFGEKIVNYFANAIYVAYFFFLNLLYKSAAWQIVLNL